MTKVLFFDTETSGLDPQKHGIISIAFMVEIDGAIVEEREFHMNPETIGRALDPKALAINGFTPEQIRAFPDARLIKKEIEAFLAQYISKFDKTDKFVPAGYNVRFDIDMLQGLWKACGDDYLFSWIQGATLDPLQVAQFLEWSGLMLPMQSRKLVDMAAVFGIDTTNAHDASADIRMTREVALRMRTMITGRLGLDKK